MSNTERRQHTYASPLGTRYVSPEMRELFSAQRKHSTWRELWLALAQCEKALGLDIPDKAIAQMQEHLDDIDFAAAAEYERKFRHDVMAHIHAFADVAPAARGIIHLGATSQFVNDNADLLIAREAMVLLRKYLANIIDALGRFAVAHRELPCLAFTHFQPAQPTTVGKRAALWCYDFVRDLEELERRLEQMEARGVKGTTGTQASFLALFEGDREKVRRLDRLVSEKMGFPRTATITGQTISRKIELQWSQTLAGIGVSVHKFCNDVRLLANMKEIEEPFASTQVGSSAMAYKRNPMRCERATGLARFLIDVAQSPAHTAAEQWLERTLDDSSNRRLALTEAFLTADAICRITLNVASGLVVYPAVIGANLARELPFMATENILMEAVKHGGDRQELHEKIRRYSQEAAAAIKQEGKPNDLVARLQADPAFAGVDFDAAVDAKAFIGRAPEQVDEFIAAHVDPVRERYAEDLGMGAELRV